MVQRVALMAAAIDVGYVLLFWWLGSVPLALVNVVSIAMYVGAYQLVKMRHNTARHHADLAGVMLHAALARCSSAGTAAFTTTCCCSFPTIVVANTHVAMPCRW